MNLDNLASLQQHGVSLLLKVGILTCLALFFAFLLVVAKQIKSMNQIVTQPDLFPYLNVFAIGLLTITITLFIIVTVIL